MPLGRFKLTTLGPLLIGFLVMLALGAVLLASRRTGNEIIERSVIDSGQTIISASSTSLFNSLYTLDVDGINIALNQLTQQDNIVHAAVRDRAGQAVAKASDGWVQEEGVSQNLSVEALGKRDFVHRSIGRHLVLSGPISAGPEQIGTLEIVFDKTSLQASLESLQRNLLFVIIGLLIGTVVILAVLIRYAMKPLGTLTAAASQIGAGNLDAPVPVSGSKEIVVFANALEHMRLNLKGLYSGLEQLVAERTQNLSKANEELRSRSASGQSKPFNSSAIETS